MSNTPPNTTAITNQDFKEIMTALVNGTRITINDEVVDGGQDVTLARIRAYHARIPQAALNAESKTYLAISSMSMLQQRKGEGDALDRNLLTALFESQLFRDIKSCLERQQQPLFQLHTNDKGHGLILTKCVAPTEMAL